MSKFKYGDVVFVKKHQKGHHREHFDSGYAVVRSTYKQQYGAGPNMDRTYELSFGKVDICWYPEEDLTLIRKSCFGTFETYVKKTLKEFK